MNIISNCGLCEAHGLHVMGEVGDQVHQCLNCGYVSSDKFLGDRETNKEYKKLPEQMQKWSREVNNRIWIPSMLTLPFGMLYPADKDGIMVWEFAAMVEEKEDEKKDYLDENGNPYDKRFDTDNVIIFKTFLDGMAEMNERANKAKAKDLPKVKIPKLTKVNG